MDILNGSKRGHPSLVLLNASLPGTGDMELLHLIRQYKSTAQASGMGSATSSLCTASGARHVQRR
jgi:hypothetical protein